MSAFIRRQTRRYLTEPCVIQRAETATDAYGNVTETWVDVMNTVCRLLPLRHVRGFDGLIAEQEKGRVFYRLALPHDADLQDGDRVVCAGITYQIVQVESGKTDAADLQAVIVRI